MSNEYDTKPADPRTAFGAQPAEAELTDEDIKKFDLFTQSEIDLLMHWEMEAIRRLPYDTVKAVVDAIRERQIEIADERKPGKLPS